MRRSNLTILRDVRKHLQMETCGFDNICDPNGPPRLKDGRVVTERTVTQFIRERTKLWRESWVLGPLDEVIAKLERAK